MVLQGKDQIGEGKGKEDQTQNQGYDYDLEYDLEQLVRRNTLDKAYDCHKHQKEKDHDHKLRYKQSW